MSSTESTGTIVAAAMVCPACRFEGGGPSDHEPWCGLFMVGPVALEGQTSIFDVLDDCDS